VGGHGAGHGSESDRGRHPRVVALDATEEHDDQRHHYDDEPGSLGELGGDEDEGGERAEQGTQTIEQRAALPVRRTASPPVHHHARLGERETGEDADGEHRD